METPHIVTMETLITNMEMDPIAVITLILAQHGAVVITVTAVMGTTAMGILGVSTTKKLLQPILLLLKLSSLRIGCIK